MKTKGGGEGFVISSVVFFLRCVCWAKGLRAIMYFERCVGWRLGPSCARERLLKAATVPHLVGSGSLGDGDCELVLLCVSPLPDR